jgi:hypothetical protein
LPEALAVDLTRSRSPAFPDCLLSLTFSYQE